MMNSVAAPAPVEATGRKYRSKKHRPCDLCRSRKIQCKLQNNETTCALCTRLQRDCTYVMGPLRRKSRASPIRQGQHLSITVDPRPRPGRQAANVAVGAGVSLQEGETRADDSHMNTFWANGASPDQRSPGATNGLMMDWSAMDFLPGQSCKMP